MVWCDSLLTMTALSLVGGQSVYGSWSGLVGLSSPHCPNLVLFYFILGVFAPQKLDRP